MNSLKSIFSVLVFLLLAAAFIVLIWFEIDYGIAGGKFGGVEMKDMPGTFWFLIGIQSLWSLGFMVSALKELRKMMHTPPPSKFVTVYWIGATILIIALNLLAVWAGIEMVIYMYRSIIDFEMPSRAVFAGFYLIAFSVFCYICYQFLFRSLVEEYYPKARYSFQLLRNKNSDNPNG